MKGRVLKSILAVLSCVCLGAGFVACRDGDSEQTEMQKAYEQYVLYTEGEGRDPLSYDEWLAAIIKGEKGDTGAQGTPGQDGQDGDKGEDGKSAYQIWLDNGHEGTEEDFLNWLKGEKGDKGDKGD